MSREKLWTTDIRHSSEHASLFGPSGLVLFLTLGPVTAAEHRSRRRIRPRVARFAPGARTCQRHRDVPSGRPRLWREAQVLLGGSGAAFFLVTFFLAEQEKVTRRRAASGINAVQASPEAIPSQHASDYAALIGPTPLLGFQTSPQAIQPPSP